jgi:hypothetical protein
LIVMTSGMTSDRGSARDQFRRDATRTVLRTRSVRRRAPTEFVGLWQ